MTEPNYCCSSTKRNIVKQQSNNLGHTTLNLGSDANFVTTQIHKSRPALGNGNFYNLEPVASLENKNSNKTIH